jgi:hypothetical protein
LRVCAHGFSSSLAVLGGALFLVLPVAFLTGTVSILYEFSSDPQCISVSHCPIAIVPVPGEMALYPIFLGIIGILLGLFVLKLGPRPRVAVALGFASSLGLTAFLFGMAISYLETFSIAPVFFLAFPDLSIAVMVGSIVVFLYEFFQARISFPLTIAEAKRPPMMRGREEIMRFWIIGASAILAILGGVLFLVLPFSLSYGKVSVLQLPSYSPCGSCLIPEVQPLSGEMVSFLEFLGGIGVLLGLLVLVMHVKPRNYLTWALPSSLGLESLLFWILLVYIQGKYWVSPMIYSLFLPLATIVMFGATLVLSLGLVMSNYPRTINNDEHPLRPRPDL